MAEIPIQYILTAVIYVECLVGFTVNMMMVAANFMKWRSLRSLPTCDKILSSLGISRALYFLSIIVRNVIFQFLPWLLQNNMVKPFLYIQMMVMFYSSNWIATILCVFYCVNIVTYNYKLFIFLKTRISTKVPQLILASLLISLISSLLLNWFGFELELQKSFNGSINNMMKYRGAPSNFNNQFLIFAVSSFPPFLIFCVANSLLIHFLLIHTRRMRSNESHLQSPNLKSHFSALKSMSLFLVLQIILFTCMNLLTSGTFLTSKFTMLISSIILCSLPLFHSLYMISFNSEVKKMFISMSKSLCLIRSS